MTEQRKIIARKIWDFMLYQTDDCILNATDEDLEKHTKLQKLVDVIIDEVSSQYRKKVFVYGSLKEGLHNHYMLGGTAKFIGEDTIKGEMYSMGSYPCITKGDDTIYGEIWEIDNDKFNRINSMEVSAGYEAVLTETENGVKLPVFFFVGSRPLGERIESGLWEEKMIKMRGWD